MKERNQRPDAEARVDNAGVTQLRNYAEWERDHGGEKIHILDWAADEIERLRARVAELEAGGEPAWYEHPSDSASIYAKPDFSKKQDYPTKEGKPLFYAPQPVKVPEGYALVPIEPTKKMVAAGYWAAFKAPLHPDPMNGVGICYKAMLAAQELTK